MSYQAQREGAAPAALASVHPLPASRRKVSRWGLKLAEYLTDQALDEKTIDVYRRKLEQAELWCRDNGRQLRLLTPTDTRRMAEELWPYAHSSRRQARSALKYFWEMEGRADSPHRSVPVPKKPRGRNLATSPENARALVKVALGWHSEGLAVLVGLYMALRASEIGAMEWSRFDHDLAWYTVTGKGAVTDTVPVNGLLRAELEPIRQPTGFLFPGSRNRAHVSGTTVRNWTVRVAAAAGVEGVSPHVLRHTAITEVNDRTQDLRATQRFARHARPETTALYTRVESDRLMAAAEAIDYLE